MTISIQTIAPSPAFISPLQTQAATAESIMGKAAEELSFGITPNRRTARRSVTRFSPQPRQNKINQVLALLESGVTSGARFSRLQRLSKAARSEDGDIDGFLKRYGLDPEDSALLLQQILNDLDMQGDHASVLYHGVIAAQQSLDDDHGLKIRARIHALETALREGMDATQTVDYQDGYLAMILGSGSCITAIDALLRRFKKQIRYAMRLLIKTLGQEIDSQWACCEPEYLHLLRQALYEVGGIANTYDDCETLTIRWEEKKALLIDDPVQLTRDLISLSAEPWAIGMKFTGLADRYTAIRWRLAFIVRLRTVVHAMPERLFFDQAAQQRVFEAVQQAVDDDANNEPF
jgi:hypothetical protein